MYVQRVRIYEDEHLRKIYNTLRYEWPEVSVDETVARDAVKPIERMLELS